jgi:curved DNA-binding protein CbpA
MAINTNIPVDVTAIELKVATELAEAEYRIMQETGKIANAKNLLSNLASPERSSELRKLYRQMAKQLHPDVNPNLTDEQQQIWHTIKDAYQAGDLEKLKALELIYEKQLKAADAARQELSEEELQLKIEVLKEGCKVLNEQIKLIKTEFPFTIEANIKDEEWVATEQEKLKAEIEALQLYETELTLQYQQLIETL